MAEWIWIGEEDVRCEIEIEVIRDRPTLRLFRATIRRIQRDGLLPLSFGDGRPAEYVETEASDALARAKLFLDRRFGFGALDQIEGATSGMRVFAMQEPPDTLVIAGYARYGCPICRIGEPDEDKFDHWLAHVQREHGYDVIADYRELAPGIPYIGRQFRVIRLRRRPPIRPTVETIETAAAADPRRLTIEDAARDSSAETVTDSPKPEITPE